MYQPREDARLFSWQFQPYFSPLAQRARWVRIGRNLVLLQGFINLCYRLLHPTEEWRPGVPVGLRAPLVIAGGEALELLCTYQLLQLTIRGPPLSTPEGYDLLRARNSLLDSSHRSAPVILTLSPVKLEPTDEDYFQSSAINPEYDQNTFSEDGVHLTCRERRQLQASAGNDEIATVGSTGLTLPNLVISSPPARSEDATGVPTPTSSTSASTPASAFSTASSSSRHRSGAESHHSRPTQHSRGWCALA